MPTVKFTPHLQRFFPDLKTQEVEGTTVADLIKVLEQRYPGLTAYIVDEHGKLRKHVNIFIGEELIRDRETLGDIVLEKDRVFIFQALSGG